MRARRFFRSEKATVMVEFAMVLPIFLLIAWAVIDFARAYYTLNSLSAAVREGARVAAVGKDYTNTADSAAGVAAAKARVTATFNAFGGSPIPPDSIKVIPNTGAGTVTVQVKGYTWATSTPINVINGGQIIMTRTATFRLERFGS
jgi:Flp pilus assembly protein TadG